MPLHSPEPAPAPAPSAGRDPFDVESWPVPPPMRTLGRTGLRVPAIGLGCAGIGLPEVDDSTATATIERALEHGLRLIDTSPLYGESERRVGQALRGVPRDRFVLSSKTGTHPARRGDYSRDATLWSIENSLRLLGVDRLDIAFVHDPDSMEPVLAPGGALDTLEELRAQGVVVAIGLGQRRFDFHRQALETARFDALITFNDFHPLRTSAAKSGLLQLAASRETAVLNGSPLSFGLLAADTTDPDIRRRYAWQPRELARVPEYQGYCRDRGATPEGVALAFCLREPGIHATLSGAKTPRELDRNLEGAMVEFDTSFWNDLSALGLDEGEE
ncbi:MAG: aldo/keto reductase [Armatimonadota bacterium]